ncbi:DUF6194 family protein [Rhodoligotrophos defluvii]|uniref:DUF6194 family protein n=1 Tax=Rhodoligotrophos defluvii TaxID=2561934 RepID=UPI0010C991EE|nr:DUF6194 family protein [Rhodoligotrophos defluvii]
MPPSLDAIRHDIASMGSDVHVDATTPDLFFFRGEERRMPFATIVTRDTEFDSFSRLDIDGAFRLNIGLNRDAFAALFPSYASRKALEAADIDYSARDTLLPHPVYGRMHWVCAISPDRCYAKCRDLLSQAYEQARR